MNKDTLIIAIEKEARESFENIVKTGVIFKDKSNSYKVDNSSLKNKRKLIKLFEDLKYRDFCYIPF